MPATLRRSGAALRPQNAEGSWVVSSSCYEMIGALKSFSRSGAAAQRYERLCIAPLRRCVRNIFLCRTGRSRRWRFDNGFYGIRSIPAILIRAVAEGSLLLRGLLQQEWRVALRTSFEHRLVPVDDVAVRIF